jgi:hypothetical protein
MRMPFEDFDLGPGIPVSPADVSDIPGFYDEITLAEALTLQLEIEIVSDKGVLRGEEEKKLAIIEKMVSEKSEMQLESEIQDLLEEYGQMMLEYAKRICPVGETGDLQDSLYLVVEKDEVSIDSTSPYFDYVEGRVHFVEEAVSMFEDQMYNEIDQVTMKYFEEYE